LSLNEWLSYIESLHPTTIDLGLSRVKQVANNLGITTATAKIITISGTNGKGTTVATLEAIYQAAGYHVAAYTSPHLINFDERIRINGKNVAEATLGQAFEIIEAARGDITLTYFEFTTLAAFWIFAQCALQVWILEVGLGGRLDAVNIIDADVAIITNVAIDHQEWLGNNRAAIAKEKLGITRPYTPLVYGETNPPDGFLDYVQKHNVYLYQVHQEFTFAVDHEKRTWEWRGDKHYYPDLYLPPFITLNMACAIQAIECLQAQLPVSTKALQQGLQQIKLTGRCQVIGEQPWQLIDVAHNPHGSHYLAEFVSGHRPAGKIIAIFSALADKDIDGIVAPLLQLVDEWFVAGLSVSRGMTAGKIKHILNEKVTTPVYQYQHIAEAYRAALARATAEDGIVIFGSFHTVSEVLREQI